MQYIRLIIISMLCLQLLGCAVQQVRQCPPGTQDMPDCPPANAVDDKNINKLYASRTWQPPGKLQIDPIRLGEEASIPINKARAKVIGPTYDDALTSLAAKIWLIENARHTLDVMYYIFKRDPVGYAVLGALCNAVQRGVDVRIMVDSLGSIHPTHDELRALETCSENAGFMRNADGQVTTRKARVQVVIFNAITKFHLNRRSHDKLLVVDGHFPDKAAVMTGGRNISLDYYGINEDGSRDPTAFRDLEILLRGSRQPADDSTRAIGEVSELYYTLLFLHEGNRRLRPLSDDESNENRQIYQQELEKSRKNLAFVKGLPSLQKWLQQMPEYMSEGFRSSKVRLAHQLGNLTNVDVTTQVRENIERNPNSILYLIGKVARKAIDEGRLSGTLRIVSPYLFVGMYYDKQGNVIYDGAKEILQLLEDNPDLRIEIVTNSVLTSDNFSSQSIIDMDTAPRLLLDQETRDAWRNLKAEDEVGGELTSSASWREQINHPRLVIYETGRLDSSKLGDGDTHYGKLHAKFFVIEDVGFVGTTNFDYRSRLFNSEMGYFFKSDPLANELNEAFDHLIETSYRWGSPEWLEMRSKTVDIGGMKGFSTKHQRKVYKTLKATGLHWLF